MDFGLRVKKLMDDQELNSNKFARKIAVSQPTINHWLSGYCRPSVEMVTSICDTFNVSADWLLFGKGEMYRNGI